MEVHTLSLDLHIFVHIEINGRTVRRHSAGGGQGEEGILGPANCGLCTDGLEVWQPAEDGWIRTWEFTMVRVGEHMSRKEHTKEHMRTEEDEQCSA